MTAPETPCDETGRTRGHRSRDLPQGYRTGLITAITVLLGFSLGFLRYWGFDAPGEWSSLSVLPGVGLFLAILAVAVALGVMPLANGSEVLGDLSTGRRVGQSLIGAR